MNKKENSLIDIMKFLLAILIVCAHYAAEWGKFPAKLDYCFSLYIIVVPFFFTCSGYFLYSKVKKTENQNRDRIYKDYIIRIFQLYLAWSIIYFGFKVLGWLVQGVSLDDVLHYLHVSLVFTTYPTIWFLPACAVGAFMLYVLNKKLSMKSVGIIALAFYFIGSLGYSYSFLLEDGTLLSKIYSVYDMIFVTTRNGIFNGFPWIVMGGLIAEYGVKLKQRRVLYGCGTFLFLILVVIESVVIKVKFHSSGLDTIFSLIPFIFFIMIFLTKENVFVSCGNWMRKMSTLIFVCQRIFLTAIPTMLPATAVILTRNSYVGIVYILICVILTSELILLGSKKYKILRKLW